MLSCGENEIRGCTNSFASNFDSSATEDCCCEYDLELLVSELIGDYTYKVDISELTNGFSYGDIKIEENPENTESFIIDYLSTNPMVASFEDGQFVLTAEVKDFIGCNYQSTGTLSSIGGIMILDLEYRAWGLLDSPSQFECSYFNDNIYGELLKK